MTVRISAVGAPAWFATGAEGVALGTAALNDHELSLAVHPAERRRGVGTRLLAAAAAGARARGLTRLIGEQVVPGSPGDLFCRARGMRPALTLEYTRLELARADPAVPVVPGYRLVHWAGVVPTELNDGLARARTALDDMPSGELGTEPETWDAQRNISVARAVEERGETLLTVAAVDAGGQIAGFTELVVGDPDGDAQHYGTGVLPAHRGRGLARAVKAEMIHRARERFPRLRGLLADTADVNAAMRRVNERLGYEPSHRTVIHRLDL